MKRVLILVEGQTEERFVKDVLAPSFWERRVYLSPTLLVTKRIKNGPSYKGGVTSFAHFESDVRRLLHGAGDALVSTMIDYYGLPSDFPGMTSRPVGRPALERARHVELAIHAYFDNAANLLPFLAVHEFEAWLFSESSALADAMNAPRKRSEIETIRATVSTPEEINERPGFAPSHRILQIFPDYRKTLHGAIVSSRIGLERMCAECPHLSWWISQLEGFSRA